ncbi:DUF6456 domain-containing protein [Methylobrevis albus]|uniref:DNA replication protein n=1 Tax=Methylobrevis albus TaxID=2793297 RepID=A0A931I0T5_9HYPH|nr:DUF6456 domain-containing protein [Methylobrevis albus]MBH0237166.1 DNA replication protein [Methylobrevis albus]
MSRRDAPGAGAGPADRDESPLDWLRRRRDKAGEPLLDDAAFEAGERLRRDFTIAGLMPRTTMNWDGLAGGAERRGGGAGAALTIGEAALAARGRFEAAIAAVGPELSGILIDVCCFLKGLSEVERERQWPARSAKLMLLTALHVLARHYGLGPATGPATTRLRHWGSDGYRPTA